MEIPIFSGIRETRCESEMSPHVTPRLPSKERTPRIRRTIQVKREKGTLSNSYFVQLSPTPLSKTNFSSLRPY